MFTYALRRSYTMKRLYATMRSFKARRARRGESAATGEPGTGPGSGRGGLLVKWSVPAHVTPADDDAKAHAARLAIRPVAADALLHGDGTACRVIFDPIRKLMVRGA
jgi:hypothetical protein